MDDSRRVSSAAAAGLEAYQAQTGQISSPNPPAEPADMPDAPRLMQRTAPEPVVVDAAEIPVRGKAERVATRHPNRGVLGDITDFVKTSSWIHSPLFPVITAWSLGWFLSLGLGLLKDDSRYLYLGWGIAGLCADLILFFFYRKSKPTRLPLLTFGWMLILALVYVFYHPMYYTLEGVGSDSGAIVAAFLLLLWMTLAGFLTALRILPEGQRTNWRRYILYAGLCWGAAFLLSLLITGLGNWSTALNRFINDYPTMVKEELGGNAFTYFSLSVNGILTALLGFYAWSRLKGIRQK
jgi:hypothetical protein